MARRVIQSPGARATPRRPRLGGSAVVSRCGRCAALVRVAADFNLKGTVHAVLWIAIAALLFHVDHAAGRADSTSAG